MKKILILCQNNTARSQMAEGYFRFFAGNRAEVYSAGLKNKELHPLAYQIMDEDNIDIKEQHPKLAKKLLKNRYDFLITFSEDIPKSVLRQIKVKRHLHLPVKDPILDEENMENAFRNTREVIKKFVLKFIGQELAHTVKP